MGIINRDWIIFPIAFLVLVMDQISKYWVRTNFSLGQSVPEDWPVRLTYYTNSGAAFGLFPNQTVVFIVVAIAAIALIAAFYRRLPREANIVRVGLGLQLGGAAGNLTDRLLLGRVTDFIDLGVWPVFNLADSSVVVGVGLLVFYLLFDTPQLPEPAKAEPFPQKDESFSRQEQGQ